MFETLNAAIRAGRAGPWVALALLVRLPALRFHDGWNGDALGFLYFGAALWRGWIPDWHSIYSGFAPATSLLMGTARWIPESWQGAWIALLQTGLAAALIVPLGVIARRRAGAGAAAWTMAIAALIHPLVLSAGRITGEPLTLLALIGGIALLEGDSRRRLAPPLFALAALGRSEALLPAAGAAAWIWYADRKANRATGPARFALLCALGAPLLWNLAAWRATGTAPLWVHGRSAAGVGAALLDPATGGMVHELRRMDAGALSGFVLPKSGDLALANLEWWLLRAIPAALFTLLIPLGLRLARARREPLRLDGLGVALALHALPFLLVWQSGNHAPLLIAPLLPVVGAELARIAVRWRALLFLPFVPWALAHHATGWRKFAPDQQLASRTLGRTLGPDLLSDDVAAFDGGSRARWLGERPLPLMPEDAPAARWRELAAEFPAARFAVRRRDFSAPLPDDWPLRAESTAEFEVREIPPTPPSRNN